ncbi:STAS domain-containing protein [Priestia megaterium]|uniref:STAS domain-containing protein n=1 Tax=Priestia TaxID=2800373 RepID=UPI002405898B|nr:MULTISPECIES: STAS domain-containing protein [Priestia]MDG0061981.1 STAS domain-containing protein [Priestia sp. P5]MED5121911.1 STAS domain-containing protein [Priestia megaterium]
MQLTNIEQLHPIRDVIIQRKEELAESKKQNLAVLHDVYTDLTTFRLDLLTIYADSILVEKDIAADMIKDWGENFSNLLVNRGLPLDLALDEISYYRDIIGEIIKDEANDKKFSLNVFYEIISHFNTIVDDAVQWVSKSYLQDYTKQIKHAQYAIDELSIPIVRMTEETGILPLVGDLDTQRAQILMENALAKGSEYKLRWLIIDLSAVPIIDTMVADQLFKVFAGLQLIGVGVVLSGIRSEIAQTMVNLGITIDHIKTFASLHQAVSYTNSFTPSVG